MAKGATAKKEIMEKLKEVFPGSFEYDKVFVIPWQENGETVHIKVAMTCSKTLLSAGGDTALPGETTPTENGMGGFPPVTTAPTATVEPTAEEKANLAALISKLGL